MAVFSHIAIHQFHLPPSAAADMDGKIQLRTTVVIDASYILVTVGAQSLYSLSIEDFDTEATVARDRLINSLLSAREISDDTEKVIVSARDDVLFDWVVRIMDICKASGFAQTGLSSAPANFKRSDDE
jgi:biopolymer transport protein ExbD